MPVYTRQSGLVVAEDSVDEARLQRALEQLDSRLVLTREADKRHSRWRWRVLVVVSDDRPAVHVCDWEDAKGAPLPLAMGLVERVQERLYRLDRGLPVGMELADELNAKRQADIDRQIDEAVEDAWRTVARFGGAGHSAVFHRGRHLRGRRNQR